MVEEHKINNPIELITLMNDNITEKIPSITSSDIKAWKNGVGSPSLEQVGAITIALLRDKKISISNDSDANDQSKLFFCTLPLKKISRSLKKACHLNEKLLETAMGVDGTLHQCIDDELQAVIKSLK